MSYITISDISYCHDCPIEMNAYVWHRKQLNPIWGYSLPKHPYTGEIYWGFLISKN